jgi:hypothetical protein
MSISHACVVEKLGQEHGELREAQRAVAEALERFGFAGVAAGPQLARAIRRFADHLLRHLAYEELEGYLRAEVALRPEVAPRVRQLQEEHEELRRRVGHIGADLERRTEDPEEVLLLATDLKDLFLFLHAHEEAETRLSLDVYWSDDGPAD